MSLRISLGHDQLAWLLKVAEAGKDGLRIKPSSEGIIHVPTTVIALTCDAFGWVATATPRGLEMVRAIEAKDKAS